MICKLINQPKNAKAMRTQCRQSFAETFAEEYWCNNLRLQLSKLNVQICLSNVKNNSVPTFNTDESSD